jgi:SAM-dependent methyltransferase
LVASSEIPFSSAKESGEGIALRRRIGEGSFVRPKESYKTQEELIQWLKHLYAYEYAKLFISSGIVLDVGSGTGYGTSELSTNTTRSVGIDIWKEGVAHSHQKYSEKGLFLIASALALPFRDNCFNLVVSFQVIEHIDPEKTSVYLKEIKQVLNHGGKFIVSTPNRKIRLLPLQKVWNPDHTREFDARSLKGILEMVFSEVEIFGLFATKATYMVEYYRVKQDPLAVCIPTSLSSRIRRILPSSIMEKFMSIIRKFKRVDARPTESVVSTNSLSIKDFKVLSHRLDSCIDLYGLCKG